MVEKGGWAPDAGEIVWLQFNPQAGHEQAGHRAAVVLSPQAYNRLTGLMLCVPLTTRIKGYPFEVPIVGAPDSVALSDQVKCLDWRVRQARSKGRASDEELAAIKARLRTLLD